MKNTKTSAKEVIESSDFKQLVKKRWAFSILMTLVMLAVYFGFILTIAFNKTVFAIKISSNLTLGIVLGLGIIIFAWLMTGIYVNWANNKYDKLVEKLKSRM